MFPLRKPNTQDTISAMLPGRRQARCELWPQVFVNDPESFACLWRSEQPKYVRSQWTQGQKRGVLHTRPPSPIKPTVVEPGLNLFFDTQQIPPGTELEGSVSIGFL